jgi:hypothetical protein
LCYHNNFRERERQEKNRILNEGKSRFDCVRCISSTSLYSNFCTLFIPTQSYFNCSRKSTAGSSILRRPRGAGASFAARAGWFASRGASVSRSSSNSHARHGMIMHEDVGFDEDDLWETVVNGGGGGGGDDSGGDAESAIEALAMEVSGVEAGLMPNRSSSTTTSSSNRLSDGRQRAVLDWARVFSHAGRVGGGDTHPTAATTATTTDPIQLQRIATENAIHYRPFWQKPTSLISSRSRSVVSSSNNNNNPVLGIEIGEGTDRNVAHLPNGATEGLAVRADPTLPRLPNGNISVGMPILRKVFGFRVAFDHPACEKGHDMGGCYLVGVTTSGFTNYNELNALQQSPYFWGIEDRGSKYEGPRYHQSNRGGGAGSGVISRRHSTVSNATYSRRIGNEEAPNNMFGVLFGSRDVVTVIADLDHHSLTFWRDETLLGTLIQSLPRNGTLYPVAVPFNCGVSVAITALDDTPLPQ